jgi:hypothetical protein
MSSRYDFWVSDFSVGRAAAQKVSNRNTALTPGNTRCRIPSKAPGDDRSPAQVVNLAANRIWVEHQSAACRRKAFCGFVRSRRGDQIMEFSPDRIVVKHLPG